MQRLKQFIAYAVITSALLSSAVWANTEPVGKSPYPGGHLRFAYRTTTGEAGATETTVTTVKPIDNGHYQVITTTEQSVPPEGIRLSFFGTSLKWLGLYISEDKDDKVDISALDAFADMPLELDKTYILPDGGKLQTRGRITIAGVSGIEAVYTQANMVGVTITVVLADDLFVRQFLPFPLKVQLQYSQPASTTQAGEENPIQVAYLSGTIELIEYIWINEEGQAS